MATVTVFKYYYTHPKLGEKTIAPRMGTEKYIETMKLHKVEGSGIEVDASKVDASGKTETGFSG